MADRRDHTDSKLPRRGPAVDAAAPVPRAAGGIRAAAAQAALLLTLLAAGTANIADAAGMATAADTASTADTASDGIPEPLPGTAPGDAERGRAIVANRQVGLCLLCHTGPIPEEPFQGNLAPDLAGAGERASAAQLRQRIVDPARVNPATIMPAYFKTEGLTQVAPAYRGKTILTAQQVEDVVAYLQTLRTLFAPQPPATPPAPPSKEAR